MDHMTIEKLKVNTSAKLNADTKKALVKIIEDEFNSQGTVYNAVAERKRDEILDQYKKGVGYNKLKSRYDDIVSQLETLESKKRELRDQINSKGLDVDGTRYSPGYGDKESSEMKEARRKMDQLLKTVEEMAPNNLRNKIISRMWLAETNGEACVILQQVLGNGIIPTLNSNNLLEHKSA